MIRIILRLRAGSFCHGRLLEATSDSSTDASTDATTDSFTDTASDAPTDAASNSTERSLLHHLRSGSVGLRGCWLWIKLKVLHLDHLAIQVIHWIDLILVKLIVVKVVLNLSQIC